MKNTNEDIYMNKEKYICTDCKEELHQWDFSIFNEENKQCHNCFFKENE